MAAISNSIVARDAVSHLAKRNWAQQEPGVIVVFCIVGIVGIGVISYWIYKKIAARSAAKQSVV